MPTAQSLLANTTAHFSPETVSRLCSILDDAWATVEPGSQFFQEGRRQVLAAAIVDLAIAGQTDPDKIKAYALSRLHSYVATDAKRQALLMPG